MPSSTRPGFHYERLSSQDKTFLDLEGPSAHQHIGAVLVFEAAGLRTAEGGVDIERIRKYVASRLDALPRYRQRLAWIPLERHPVWVDDEHFQLDFHVRHTALPFPGDVPQMRRLCGRLFSQPLDRHRPLWEFWVVEGLAGGERFAVVQKAHHCMIDGVSGVDLMALTLRPEPSDAYPPAPSWQPRRAPAGAELLTAEVQRRIGTAEGLLGGVPEVLRDPRRFFDGVREGAEAVAETLGAGLRPASDTPLNRTLGPHRAFDGLVMDLSEVKRIKDGLGGTVNDVVLATVAGALRRFFVSRRVPLEGLRVRANVPVSVRHSSERGSLGNRIALWMTDLPVDEAEPRRRLERVRETTARLKRSRQALGAEVLAAVSDFTSSSLLSLAVRVSTSGRPYNLVVTNVPGPQIPLYLLEARLAACFPAVNLLPRQGLGVALFSYDGALCWGLIADPELVPDLAEFPRWLRHSFAELRSAAEGA